MIKICCIGAPSSGKTTLTNAIFTELKRKGINTEMTHEWIRLDVQQSGPLQTIWEQYRTRNHQKEMEDAIPSSTDVLISDAGTLSMFFFAVRYLNSKNPRERLVLQDLYKYLLDDLYLKRYDLIFYLPLEKGININDGTRFQSQEDVEMLDMHMRVTFMSLYKTEEIYEIGGPLDGRLDKAMSIIDSKIQHLLKQKDLFKKDIDGNKRY